MPDRHGGYRGQRSEAIYEVTEGEELKIGRGGDSFDSQSNYIGTEVFKNERGLPQGHQTRKHPL